MTANCQLALNPHGRLLLAESDDLSAALPADDTLREAFATSAAHGLLAISAQRRGAQTWPAVWLFWREFADAYLTTLAPYQSASARLTVVQGDLPTRISPPTTGR